MAPVSGLDFIPGREPGGNVPDWECNNEFVPLFGRGHTETIDIPHKLPEDEVVIEAEIPAGRMSADQVTPVLVHDSAWTTGTRDKDGRYVGDRRVNLDEWTPNTNIEAVVASELEKGYSVLLVPKFDYRQGSSFDNDSTTITTFEVYRLEPNTQGVEPPIVEYTLDPHAYRDQVGLGELRTPTQDAGYVMRRQAATNAIEELLGRHPDWRPSAPIDSTRPGNPPMAEIPSVAHAHAPGAGPLSEQP
jgi:hypothetical protein